MKAARSFSLDPPVTLKEGDCVWGHDLVVLAKELAKRRTDFDLTAAMTFLGPWQHEGPPTIETGFEVFNPFFDELRYPHELTLSGVGEDDRLTLAELVKYLQLFLEKAK